MKLRLPLVEKSLATNVMRCASKPGRRTSIDSSRAKFLQICAGIAPAQRLLYLPKTEQVNGSTASDSLIEYENHLLSAPLQAWSAVAGFGRVSVRAQGTGHGVETGIVRSG
jgi:hypothetical protein